MTTTNDPKLKLAVARMLPSKIIIQELTDTWTRFLWTDNLVEVLETEWLYIVSLLEQELGQDWNNYWRILFAVVAADEPAIACDKQMQDLLWYRCIHATFNQRAQALCKVKGVEVV